jgi:hypothetical protein
MPPSDVQLACFCTIRRFAWENGQHHAGRKEHTPQPRVNGPVPLVTNREQIEDQRRIPALPAEPGYGRGRYQTGSAKTL